MINKINISHNEKMLIVYVFLTMFILTIFWQVHQFDFANLDDPIYVTGNSYIQSGMTLDGLFWAFSTTYAEFWHPLTWLSLMFDYQFYGLNAGGYHVTNLILHILSTLLLFGLFARMTRQIWPSAFVAAFFALHPLHVESVAWIAERKDVLSAFFWMLTLCLYVYYTEQPAVKRYLLVLFSFVLALMSKPMVVTLPILMILLDYWPLKRFASHKGNVFLWQLKEKLFFLILSIIFSIITLAAQPHSTSMRFPLFSRLANAPVSFVTYIGKTFWPLDMAVFYPFETQIHTWQVWGTTSLIVMISLFVIVMAKRCPYLFVGWLWYAISLAPVIGIIQVGNHALADRYHYLPSIGISMMIAWGLPALINNLNIRNNIVLPAAILFLTMMAFLSFKQCGYWGNDFELFNHAARVTQNNDLALNNRGVFYGERGQYQLAIKDFKQIMSHDPHRLRTYYNLGLVHTQIGQYQKAIHYINAAIRLKSDYADAYFLRGFTYYHMGQYKRALDDYSRAIHIKPDYSDSYCNRAAVYFQQGNNQKGCLDAQKACSLGNCKSLESAKAMGLCQ